VPKIIPVDAIQTYLNPCLVAPLLKNDWDGLGIVEDTADEPVPVVILALMLTSISISNMSVTPTASSESENESGTIGSSSPVFLSELLMQYPLIKRSSMTAGAAQTSHMKTLDNQ